MLENRIGEIETYVNCCSSFVSNLSVPVSSKITIQPPETQSILDWITDIVPIDTVDLALDL